MKQCGIYIIKNTINDKVYVGQSTDISMRWWAHKNAAKRPSRQDANTDIHSAMRELGVENFYMEVLELCKYSQLSNREKYWIKHYNSYYNGYNMTLGGESNKGEINGRALLNGVAVREIRTAYDNHVPFREVYKKYKNFITQRGLRKIWNGETWKHIMMEVYTEENKLWHATQAKANEGGNVKYGKNNQERACSQEEISQMRRLREKEKLSYAKIGEIVNRSASTVRKYC